MRRRFREILSALTRDRRGNFAVITALTMMPVLLSIGAAVDMGLFYRGRTIVQSATDAAALAAAKQFFVESDPARLEEYARDFFEANTAGLVRMDATMTYEGTDWTADRQRELKIRSCYEYKPIFLAMLHVQFDGLAGENCAETESVIVVGNTTVEVAMVLDTSGSMNDSPAAGGAAKIATLRTQAAKAVETLFGSGSSVGGDDPVRVGVVPFSGGVNIGKEFRDEWWMDPKGQSPIHHENFNWDSYTTPPVLGITTKLAVKATSVGYPSPQYDNAWVLKLNPLKFLTRQAVYDSLGDTAALGTNYRFRGCVESRPAPYGITDTPPNAAVPATLFVPYFAPDESNTFRYNYWPNSYLNDDSSSNNTARMTSMNKYFNNPTKHYPIAANQHFTPSWMCDSDPVLAITTNKAAALAKVKSLVATGSTNVAQGVEWGWHLLSKNMPFAEGRPAGDEKNVKAMIVMTDGEQTYYNDDYNADNPMRSAYGAYGFTAASPVTAKASRMFDYKTGASTATTPANYTASMDGRMAQLCENAKNDGRIPLETARGNQLSDERGPVSRDGIIIYTIAFDIPATSKARVDALLKGCASYKLGDLRDTTKTYANKAKYFYSAGNAAQLDAAFSDIAASLSNLRIAR